jgi:hypothetical protein
MAKIIDHKSALSLLKLAAVFISLAVLTGCSTINNPLSTVFADDEIKVVYPAEKQP